MYQAVELMKSRGAEMIHLDKISEESPDNYSFQILLYEYKDGLNKYFRSLGHDAPVKNIEELIEFNKSDPTELMYFNQRYLEMAQEKGEVFDPERPDNIHRLNMGCFPKGASIIPNPYNKIPGFSCSGSAGGSVHFFPGFPVMAWPMLEWVLDTQYAHLFGSQAKVERSVIVYEALESTLTPLMQRIEANHPGVRVFSLPSVDHPVHGRHIELGVKGLATDSLAAWKDLIDGLHHLGAKLGPEMVRD